MLRGGLAVFGVCLAATVVLAGRTSPTFGDPLPGLTDDQRARFAAGREEFADVETIEDGLGPVFNEASCAACHIGPNGAIGGSNNRLETRFGRSDDQGQFDPMTLLGGSLLQDRGIGAVQGYYFAGELVPAAASHVALRRTTPLFGLGLVDAVSDGDLLKVAADEAALDSDTAGRAHVVQNIATGLPAIGRFGWKAQVPTLFVFSGDAYLNEMGITNPLFPNENCPRGDCSLLAYNPRPDVNDDGSGVQAFADFMVLLAPPPRGAAANDATAGAMVFAQVGCANCHRPTLRTGPNAIAALDRVAFHPYSDFLLHDMGALGDGITQGDVGPTEMRTAPLWGLSVATQLLHDGRASSIEQAIQAHDGQGASARDKYAALTAARRAQLLAFLRSL